MKTSTSVPPPPARSCVSSLSPRVHLLAAGTAAAVSTFAVQPLDVLKTRLQVSHSLYPLKPGLGIAGNLRTIFRMEGVSGLYRGIFPSMMSVVPSIAIYFTLYNEFKRTFLPRDERGLSPMYLTTVQSLSAGLASCCTSVVTNPLWMIKTRLQTQPHVPHLPPRYRNTFHALQCVIREEGLRGLYKGLGASFLNSTHAMIQFPVYEKLKEFLCSTFVDDSCHNVAVCSFAASSVSAALASVITYPSDVVRSRLQIQGRQGPFVSKTPVHRVSTHHSGIFKTFKSIWRHDGVKGLYRGMATSLVRLVPAHAISFTVYEILLRFLSDDKKL